MLAGNPELRARILGRILTWLLRLQQVTWHVEVQGLDRLDRRITHGEPTLITFWHGKYLPLFALLRGRSACVFTSQSFRGNVISEICHRFGYDCVQIPDHARERSLAWLRHVLVTHRTLGIAVDGPLGPYHVVKHGVIKLASDLGFVLLPVSVASRHRWVLRRRWDQMEVPWLFTRICLVIGEALEIPAGLTQEGIELWTRHLQSALEVVERLAREKARIATPRNSTGPEPSS